MPDRPTPPERVPTDDLIAQARLKSDPLSPALAAALEATAAERDRLRKDAAVYRVAVADLREDLRRAEKECVKVAAERDRAHATLREIDAYPRDLSIPVPVPEVAAMKRLARERLENP